MIKDWVFISIFGVLVLVFVVNTYREDNRFEEWVIRVSKTLEERDERQFRMNQRLQTLEEQRDLERRVTNLEKAARTFCVSNKLEMCGKLEVVK